MTRALRLLELRSHEVPTAPLVLYAVGAVPVSLRAFVPEAALNLGLVAMALGVGWLSVWFFNRTSRISTWADHVTDEAVATASR